MVKHSAGSQQSSVSRASGGSQISGLKDLTLLDRTNLESEENPVLPTPVEGQWGFLDSVYLLAAAIFQNTHQEKPAAHRLVSFGKKSGLPVPGAKDEVSQRSAYELAFNALKYQELLEDIMIDSCFYFSQPMPDDQMSLVAVMLYDFQDRKFSPRECPGEEFIQEVRDTESCLLRFKTKLAASLARCRIKHDLLTIDCILPESVRKKQERASSLPLYAWVNTLRSSLDEVCRVLKQEGFSQVTSVRQLEGQTFCQDPHCDDMLVFPATIKADLYRTRLLSQYKLIIQDKSCCVGPYVVRPLLAPEGDVLVAGCSSGLTVAHTASLLGPRHTPRGSKSRVSVCVGERPPEQREELQETLANVGCKNVKLIPESFLSVEPADPRLQRVRLILLLPQCSVSALSNPVDFILQENGDTDLLQDLSQGAIAQTKLDALVAQQKKSLDHALKFSKVQVVVYSTCSSYPEENEEVLARALEQNRPAPDQEPKEHPFRTDSSLLVSALRGVAAGGQGAADGPFFRLEPSEHTNGCFLAVLTREPEAQERESAEDVLARAAATGILDGIRTTRPSRKEKHAQPNRQAPTGHIRTPQTRPHATASSQSRVMGLRNRETKGSSSAPMIGPRGLANAGQLSPRGKAKPRHQRPPTTTPSNTTPSNTTPSKTTPTKTTPTKTTSQLSPYSTLQSTTSPSRKSMTRLTNVSSKQHRPPKPTAPQAPAPHLYTPAAGSPPAPTLDPGQPQGRQEVMRPVTLTLPLVLFPKFSSPSRQVVPPPPVCQVSSPATAHSQWRGPVCQVSSSVIAHSQWRGQAFQVPLTRSSGSINKEALVKKNRPWL